VTSGDTALLNAAGNKGCCGATPFLLGLGAIKVEAGQRRHKATWSRARH
jgi:hypothetical protein